MTTSVALCTFNGEKYIAEQLNSIINQSVKPDQIVLSDDNSSDNTVKIATEILEKSGIDYVININKPNLGITENFDKAFSFCTGDIIIPSDQDNVWFYNFIEEFLNAFEKEPDAVYAVCSGIVTDENLNPKDMLHDNELFMDLNELDKDKFLRDSVNNIFLPGGHTTAYKNSFIKSILPSGFHYDEWAAICAGATGKIVSINKRLIYFRRHSEACSSLSGGGAQKGIFANLKEKTFDQYFLFPKLSAEAYEHYLILFKDILPEDVYKDMAMRVKFHYALEDIRGKNLIQREVGLFKIAKMKGYKIWRGNWKMLLLDFIYLLLIDKSRL